MTRIAVSNIAWEREAEPRILAAMKEAGASGVEVAPSKIWPGWEGASPASARGYREELADKGFAIPALQAILFGKPEMKVFGDAASREALLSHLETVSELAAAMGAGVMVFGSPKNRDPGDLPPQLAFEQGAEFFARAAEIAAAHGTSIGLEPNPKHYACRFLTNWKDVKRMVETVDHAGLVTHLDVACIALEGDDPAEAVDTCKGGIGHFHVTEPELGAFSDPAMPHQPTAEALKRAGYEGWLSVEMRPAPDPVEAVRTALNFVKATYG